MAKSKLVQANEKIAASVTAGFQKVNDTVVGTYTKIEDRFVDHYLRRDDESIQQAKERLQKERSNRMKKSNFTALILGVTGGVFFALGMCMALLPEWGMSALLLFEMSKTLDISPARCYTENVKNF